MKAYAEYKDSGIEWIGKIPKSWSVNKIKYVSDINSEALTEKTPEELEIHYIDIGNCNADGTYNPPEPIKFVEAPSRARRVVHTNDTIISTVRTYLKSIAFIKESTNNLIASTGFAVLKPININPRFLFYSVKAQHFIDTVCSLSVGVSYPAINASVLGNIKICFPNDSKEQNKIATFLDGKVEKINDFIKKKKQLIKLLKEQRIAIINHAVTKGLNKDVELKDSGIEWIGKIPKHWIINRLASLGRFSKGKGISRSELTEEGIPAILYGDIYTKYTIKAKTIFNHTSEDSAKNSVLINKGAILFTGSGETLEEIGKSIVYLGDEQVCAGGDLILFFQEKENGEFLSYFLSSHVGQFQKSLTGKGDIVVHTYSSKLKDIRVPIPPLPEQKEIVKFLNEETSQVDKSIDKIQKEIELLQEYKEALISEAVTGKIKVTT